MRNGFAKAERLYLEAAELGGDKSGSCAIVVLIAGSKCYVANTGDSRAIMSVNKGKSVVQLSRDHKPNELSEKSRILAHDGTIYSQHANIHRVAPGGLSVSRTFGDIGAKLPRHGGKEGVVIAEPDIIKFSIDASQDFLIVGSDGLFDKLRNEEIAAVAWSTKLCAKGVTLHKMAGRIIHSILESAMHNKSTDNITAIIICFEGMLKSSTEHPYTKAKMRKFPSSTRMKRNQSAHKRSKAIAKGNMRLLDKSVF
eukprot:TRINITY_DN10952_c0_g1_i1.p1 TRINITY_DN10952_c0_g1~~TRINITY_DN10952_c0_g1_i1.p1  ORF type:complete len:254 (+),score=47.64 TRINITY_DN10952_c0_g1_i1:676-1437(+)